MKNNAERFTDTVENYLRYRPSYPQAILQLAIEQCGLNKQSVIADIGSGTGFSAKLFLENGNTVFGIEPNQAMRKAAKNYLSAYKNFHQIDGYAENTHLEEHCIDVIVVATAFHWFDIKKTKAEFQRILKPHGWVLLIWNVRDIEHSSLLQDYEQLILEYSKDYKNSPAQEFNKVAVEDFFSPHPMHQATFKNSQILDWEGFKGRLLSTSYSLRQDDPHYEEMLEQLKIIFERHQKNGQIEFLYQTKVYYGQLNP